MKTYKEFILEAKLSWWNGGRKKAETKKSQLSRERGGTPEQQAKRFQRLKKLKSSIEKTDSRESDTKPQKSSSDKRKENAVKNTGYAQTGKRGSGTPVSSVGTVSGVRRRRITDLRTGKDLGSAEPSDTRTSGRFGKVTGSRGTGKARDAASNIGG
jgi:hypothetical protein